MRTLGSRAAALLALATALAGCPKSTTVVGGQVVPIARAEDSARGELAALRADVERRPDEVAAARLEAFANRHPDVPAGAEALHEAARRWRAAGAAERAAAALQRIVAEYPLYPGAEDARFDLALANVAAGRAADGLATLASLWPRLRAEQRATAALSAADAAASLRDWGAEIKWLLEAAAVSEGGARAAAVARAAEAVDGRLAFIDVARLREELPSDSPVLPAVSMKLARIQLHLRDFASAEASAREVYLRWPESPWAADAKALVDRVGRLTFSRPDVIGVAVPLSGNYKRWGEAILQGINLALGEGSPFRVVSRDTRGEPDGAAAAIEALALEEGAIVIVGGVTNAEADRSAATAEELQVPFLSLSKQEGITDAGPFVFQNMLTASAQAKALVRFAMEKRGMRAFALLYPSIPYGVELANAFWDEVDARGGEIRAAETYASDRTTFTPLVKSMVGKLYLEERGSYVTAAREAGKNQRDQFHRRKAFEKAAAGVEPVTDFDAIFIPDQAKSVKLIAPALAVEDVVSQTCEKEEVAKIAKTTGRPDLKAVQLFGANAWGVDETLFDQSPGAVGRHVRCAIYVDGFYAGSARAETRRFVDAFHRRYGATAVPTILEASAYDAARMARGAIDQARTKSRQAVRDGLADVRGFKGATGDITFNARRMPEKELFFLTVDANGLREMTAAELAPGAAPGG
jgi:ABC-type branched-subunit amino acid transport system substrate-binding protein